MLKKFAPERTSPIPEIIRFDAGEIKEQLGLNLNPSELVILNAWKEAHLKRFINLCAEGGIENAREVYPLGKSGFGGAYLTTLINTDSSEFNCQILFHRPPSIPQVPIVVDFRSSSFVTTLEGERINLTMFINDAGEARYQIQEFAEG